MYLCCYGVKKSNGNRGRFPSLCSYKGKSLFTYTEDNFIKCHWLISHSSFTLVMLLKKLAVNIGFIIKPFSKKAVENHSRKKNRKLSFSFSIAVIDHDLHCFGRKGFTKDASPWVLLNESKSMLDLEVCLSEIKIVVSFHAAVTFLSRSVLYLKVHSQV